MSEPARYTICVCECPNTKQCDGSGTHLALAKRTLARERDKILDVIETYREFPDEFHVLDGKQVGLLSALQIIEHIERFDAAPEGFPVKGRTP
jgi:hypothetical protein